jgi:hypothetical protein
LFRRIGELLRDVIPSSAWCELDIDERRRCIETAAELLRRDLGVRRRTPLLWVDAPTDAGAAYDEESEDGNICASSVEPFFSVRLEPRGVD